MKAKVINSVFHMPDGFEYKLCVGGKVHLEYHLSDGSDSDGYDYGKYERYGNLEECDGSCRKEMDLPPEVEQLINDFLASNGKKHGEFERNHPPKKPRPEWNESME